MQITKSQSDKIPLNQRVGNPIEMLEDVHKRSPRTKESWNKWPNREHSPGDAPQTPAPLSPLILLSGLFQLQWPFAGFSDTTHHFLPQSLSQAASLTWKISGPSPLTPCHPLPKVLITPTQAVDFHSDAFSQESLPWSPFMISPTPNEDRTPGSLS